jgi:hypothetical protein
MGYFVLSGRFIELEKGPEKLLFCRGGANEPLSSLEVPFRGTSEIHPNPKR